MRSNVCSAITSVAMLLVTAGGCLRRKKRCAWPRLHRPGYMVVIGEGVDSAGMADYAKVAVPLLLKAGGVLMFTTEEGETEVIEGKPFPGSIRVFRFPSLQAARDFLQLRCLSGSNSTARW